MSDWPAHYLHRHRVMWLLRDDRRLISSIQGGKHIQRDRKALANLAYYWKKYIICFFFWPLLLIGFQSICQIELNVFILTILNQQLWVYLVVYRKDQSWVQFYLLSILITWVITFHRLISTFMLVIPLFRLLLHQAFSLTLFRYRLICNCEFWFLLWRFTISSFNIVFGIFIVFINNYNH